MIKKENGCLKGKTMKISQSKVRVEPYKATRVMEDSADNISLSKLNASKPAPARPVSVPKATNPPKKSTPSRSPSIRPISENSAGSGKTAGPLYRIQAIAQQELDLIRRMRAEAVKYQQETAMKARSEAHRLVLHTRLTTQREIEGMVRQANEEIQKVLADIRVIRITAQEELAAQRKFTDAAKLNSMSLSMKEIFKHATEKDLKKKKPATAKSQK
jgi:hypothetical protein